MIKLYPTKIEAYDETDTPMFKLEMFDEVCANIEITTAIARGESLDELFDAIRRGMDLMFADDVDTPATEV
jgi:hypothetical protein